MKKITAKWVATNQPDIYDKELRVVYSDHKRFRTGSRFDFGFLQVASGDGYIIEILPL